MSSTVAALPPTAHPLGERPIVVDGSDVPEYAFSDLWQDKGAGFTFGDVLDVINPLQHIPVVSTLYRMVSEDELGVGSRLLGGALFGGPLGILVSGLTEVFEQASGGSVEQHVASLWNAATGEDGSASRIATAGKALPIQAGDRPAQANAAAPGVVEAKPEAEPGQGAFLSGLAALHSANPVPFSPQPQPRPPVTVSPLTAVHRVVDRQPAPPQTHAETADRAAENQRIAKSVEQAQRAQAGLLMANLGIAGTVAPEDKAEPAAAPQTQPFKAHPYMLPRGASPELISQAMEKALAKYQTTLQQRNQAAPAPSR